MTHTYMIETVIHPIRIIHADSRKEALEKFAENEGYADSKELEDLFENHYHLNPKRCIDIDEVIHNG